MLTGGTDVHLVLVDLRESELDGQQAEDRLHDIGITVNRNAVPFDPRPPMVTSGLRVGTPALATRGLQADDFAEVGEIIATALTPDFEARRGELAERVTAIADRYPLYEHLGAASSRLSQRERLPPMNFAGPSTRCGRGSSLRSSRSLRHAARPRGFAVRVGAVDQPRDRGLAERPTPLLGGLAIFAGVVAAPSRSCCSAGTQRVVAAILWRRGDHHRRRGARRHLRPARAGQARRAVRRGAAAGARRRAVDHFTLPFLGTRGPRRRRRAADARSASSR